MTVLYGSNGTSSVLRRKLRLANYSKRFSGPVRVWLLLTCVDVSFSVLTSLAMACLRRSGHSARNSLNASTDVFSILLYCSWSLSLRLNNRVNIIQHIGYPSVLTGRYGSAADPDPGSCAFWHLDPGSGIRCSDPKLTYLRA